MRFCSEIDCKEEYYCKGFCAFHYTNSLARKEYQRNRYLNNKERINCINESWRKRNPEKIASNRSKRLLEDPECFNRLKRRSQNKLRFEVFSAYGGFICVRCKMEDPRCLSLDHINNDGAQHKKITGGAGSKLYRWLRTNGYPPIVQVLCMNCQFIKRANKGILPKMGE